MADLRNLNVFKPVFGSHITAWDLTNGAQVVHKTWGNDFRLMSGKDGVAARVLVEDGVEPRRVGAKGRRMAIDRVKGGAPGFAIVATLPVGVHPGPGAWAKYADKKRAYPVVGYEQEREDQLWALLGAPVPVE